MSHEERRKAAKQAFDDVELDDGARRRSLDRLFAAMQARYELEIGWYHTYANRSQGWSRLVRTGAAFFGGASILLVAVGAFADSLWPCATLPAANVATISAVVAGLILLIDQVGQITPSYTRWRVAEYRLRVHRLDFETAFRRAFGAKAEAEIDRNVFNEANSMASEAFGDVMEEILKETESWQQGVEKGLEVLQQRLAKAETEGRTRTKEAAAKQEEREREQEAVGLTVVVAKDGRTGPLKVEIRSALDSSPVASSKVQPGQTAGFAVLPGLYEARLLDAAGDTIGSRTQRIPSGNDAQIDL